MVMAGQCQTHTLLVKFSLNQSLTGQITIFISYDPHLGGFANIAITQLIAEKNDIYVFYHTFCESIKRILAQQ